LEAYQLWLDEYLNFKEIFNKSENDFILMNEKFAYFYSVSTNYRLKPQGKMGGWMPHALYFSLGQSHP
jgi:hypothetical protein